MERATRFHARPRAGRIHRGPGPWLWLAAAGLTETAWIHGLQQATSTGAWGLTLAAVIASVCCALAVTRHWPADTVYIVFVALGTLGSRIWDSLDDHALPTPLALFWLIALLIGMAGLHHGAKR